MENSFSLKRFLSNQTSRLLSSVVNQSKAEAVELFAARSFSTVPAAWVQELFDHRGIEMPMPMYGYVFIIDDKSVEDSVERNMAEYDFGDDVDRQRLIDSGWRVICSTGLFALFVDGRIVLGVDGVGYDFFKAHWEPLYDLLGYRWHLDD